MMLNFTGNSALLLMHNYLNELPLDNRGLDYVDLWRVLISFLIAYNILNLTPYNIAKLL